MAETKKTTTKKTTTKRAPRKSTKKTESVIEAVEQIQDEASAEEIKPAEVKTVSIKIGTVLPEEGLKIRSGPGTNYSKIGRLQHGEDVEVLEEKDGFVRIGKGQWCMACHVGGI